MNKDSIIAVNKLLKMLEEISKDEIYSNDYDLINSLILNAKLLFDDNYLSDELLNNIEKDIYRLDQTYDGLFELVNYYSVFNYDLRRKTKKKYIDELRKKNREKREEK